MDANALQQLISTVGFPIFVAVWYMMKTSKDTANLTQAVTDLTQMLKIMQAQINISEGDKNGK